MARLLLPIMTVALAMVAGVMAQQACQAGYSTAEIPTFDLINLNKQQIDDYINNKDFVDLVYNCFLGNNCGACTPTARQVMVLLPWLFGECTRNPAVCNAEQKSRAAYIARQIQTKYASQYQTILKTFT